MTRQEKIRRGLVKAFKEDKACHACYITAFNYAECALTYLHSQGVVIRQVRELPYKWEEIKREHRYRPCKEFTTYALRNKFGKMFGYVQKYQSITGYKCFEEPERYIVYLGDEEWAHSHQSKPTLEEAKQMLIELFLASKDNPDNEIPADYVAVAPLREEVKDEV